VKIWRGTSRTGKTFEIQGNPSEAPNFTAWVGKGRKRQAGILMDGELVWFDLAVDGTQKSSIKCTSSCRKAKGPYCTCSCGGKNHGIENRGMSETGEGPEVIYVGDH
jgi:hypothetical protein